MDAYGIAVTSFFACLFFFSLWEVRDHKRKKGSLIWIDELKPGKYKVIARDQSGFFIILENVDSGAYVGVRTYGEPLLEAGATFQWKVKKLKGYEREAIQL